MILFITGATAGFGESLTRYFIKCGHRVIGVGRRTDRLQRLHDEYGDQFFPLPLDLQDRESALNSIQTLPSAWNSIDVLVNNAGLAQGLSPAQEANLSDWETMIHTNINGLIYCTHAILPGMVKRNTGHIINLGSVAGEFPYPGGNIYGATKAFVHQFSLNLRADLLNTAVRVTCVEPGMCSGTEFSQVRFRGDLEKAASVYEGVDALTSDDIAETIGWIVSRPAHVNINVISLMPVQQAFGPFAVHRKK